MTTIYHNPAYGTSRNVLAMIRQSGLEPMQVLYLETPLSRDRLIELIAEMGISPRDLLRRKGTSFDELGLDDPSLADAEIVGAMMMHPILINRPIVITGKGTKLCRPSETVFEILDNPDTAPVILPVLTGRDLRTHAAIFSFMAGVTPPMPMFGRSLL
ncbi:arsenate reductase (glutaredoxin) [Rhodovulum sulfidophilum]|nr:arsenate reductase (glutaredoxin) [Rhodovulum sulfidophilum]